MDSTHEEAKRLDPNDDTQNIAEDFESASKDINDPDTYLMTGELYLSLGQIEKTKECFEKSKKTILEILMFLDKDNRKKIIDKKVFHSLLESDNVASVFFKKTTKNLTQEQRKVYMDLYIYSTYIVSLLHVNDENERKVACYREKAVVQKLLFDHNLKFRLNAIDYSNDPSEGRTLLDFLFEEKMHRFDNKINNEEYEAFAACFVFDYDNLNMFRLYGKNENGEEGTGVSLVFRDTFFNNEVKLTKKSPEVDLSKTEGDNSKAIDKLHLFRCVYIDPDPVTSQHIISVGRKEEYLFYKEKENNTLDDFNKYDENMKGIIKDVRAEMNNLKETIKKHIQDVDIEVVRQLLLTLRYLVKHIAFKEEQECRILKIIPLWGSDRIAIEDNYKRMFIEYSPKASSHIDRIYFGPKFKDCELFQSMLKKNGLNIPCEKSKNPLA